MDVEWIRIYDFLLRKTFSYFVRPELLEQNQLKQMIQIRKPIKIFCSDQIELI